MSETLVLTLRLLVLSWLTAKRQLIHNRSAQRNTWNRSYDFIVVGAGAAGCPVAYRLSQNPNVNVLLLEAGGAQDAIWTDINWLSNFITGNRPDIFWHYYDEPNPYVGGASPQRRVNEWMGKVIGGSTTHNGEAFNRGNRRLYDNWAKIYGAKGWSYSEVMPYFLRFENNTDPLVVSKNPAYHSTTGPVQISSQTNRTKMMSVLEKAFESFGYPLTDLNGPNQTGSSYIQQYVDTRELRVSTGNAYIETTRPLSNLHLVTGAQVIRVLFRGTTAIGVEFDRNDTSYTVYARNEIILSAGVYNSPQILMLSGVGNREHLQSHGIPVVMNLPVGNNLHNHPNTVIVSKILNPDYYYSPPRELNIHQLSDRYFKNSGVLSTAPQIALMYSTENNSDINYPNSLIFNLFSNDGIYLITPISIEIIRSRGTVRLHSSNPYIAPKIDPKMLYDPRDRQDLLDAVRFMVYVLEVNLANIVALPTFESLGCTSCPNRHMYECTEGLICLIRQMTASAYHPGGTCRMGNPIRGDVVVDPYLRVKNLYNLRVCDASIFPETPNGNPAAASIMVGEKCAQIIKNFHGIN